MANIIASVSVTDIPLMRNIITALADSAVLLRDAQWKLSNAVRADDPIMRRIDGALDHIEKLSECVPDKADLHTQAAHVYSPRMLAEALRSHLVESGRVTLGAAFVEAIVHHLERIK